jgi:hypothetical protein
MPEARCPKCGGPLERWSGECPACLAWSRGTPAGTKFALAAIVIFLLLALLSRMRQ